MKFLEVPKYNEDGSVEGLLQIAPEEAKYLISFAVNFLASVGGKHLASVAEPVDDRPQFDD